MNIAIMQPYFLPYIGYFQLARFADRFVIYDTIQYTKKGWINRNRILRNGEPLMISVPLKKDSDYLDVKDRVIADAFDPAKLSQQIAGAYRKAPQFGAVMPVIESILHHDAANLFGFLRNNLQVTFDYLGIDTPLVTVSDIDPPTELRGQDRVLDICTRLEADTYTNPIGGTELYSAQDFKNRGIHLQFLKTATVDYPQFGAPFQPHLSILDVMMFNSVERIQDFLTDGFDLVTPEGRSDV